MMTVRCGRCRTEFPVQGAGRFPCPACGAVNEVRAAPPADQPLTVPGPPPESPTPSSRAICGECSFAFIVGDIDVARCPNCGAEVIVGEAP